MNLYKALLVAVFPMLAGTPIALILAIELGSPVPLVIMAVLVLAWAAGAGVCVALRS